MRPIRKDHLPCCTRLSANAHSHLRGWPISTLQDAGAIRQCEYHGWLVDYADPNARERALEIARQDLPANISARRAITDVERSNPEKVPSREIAN